MLIALLEEGHGQGSDEEQQGKEEAESGPQQEAKGHRHGRRPGQDARRQEVTVKSAALELDDFSRIVIRLQVGIMLWLRCGAQCRRAARVSAYCATDRISGRASV